MHDECSLLAELLKEIVSRPLKRELGYLSSARRDAGGQETRHVTRPRVCLASASDLYEPWSCTTTQLIRGWDVLPREGGQGPPSRYPSTRALGRRLVLPSCAYHRSRERGAGWTSHRVRRLVIRLLYLC
jgi:hypothetical protein